MDRQGEALSAWLLGANRARTPAEVRSHGPDAVLARMTLSPADRPAPRACDTFPGLTVQLVTKGRAPVGADMGYGRFTAISSPGSFIVTPPDQACDFHTEAGFETIGLALPWSLVRGLVAPAYEGRIPDFAPLHARVFNSARVAAAVEALWSGVAAQGGAGRLLAQSQVLRLLGGLLHLVSAPSAGCVRGGLGPRRLARACEAMRARLLDGITLTELSALVGLSPAHFSRAFRQSTGLTPPAWLLERRIERAKTLLRHSNLGLAQIALETGFSAQPQFTTAFRRVVGTPPGAWRRANAN